jgi:hypothetical protein
MEAAILMGGTKGLRIRQQNQVFFGFGCQLHYRESQEHL